MPISRQQARAAMNTELTMEQAYAAMFLFLEQYDERGGADDVGVLLGSMNLLADGMPADEALWTDWANAVGRAQKRAMTGVGGPGAEMGAS